MSTPSGVQEVIAKVRERVRARRPQLPSSGQAKPNASFAQRDTMVELRRNLLDCNRFHHDVGRLNPRNPGLHNRLIQFAKKILQRSLAWYTRPLQAFQAAVTRTLNDVTRVLENLHAEARRVRTEALAKCSDLERRMAILEECRPTMEGQTSATGLNDITRTLANLQAETRQPDAEWIVQKSWLLRHLPSCPSGSHVLDIGASESTLALELASINYRITAIDTRACLLSHPNLQFVAGDICDSGLPSGAFDTAIALSTLGHMGLGTYGGDPNTSAAARAVQEIHRVLKPGGRFILTVPFGEAGETPLCRIYDAAVLRDLLRLFTLETIEYGRRLNEKTWTAPVAEEEVIHSKRDPNTYRPAALAMAVCVKSS